MGNYQYLVKVILNMIEYIHKLVFASLILRAEAFVYNQ